MRWALVALLLLLAQPVRADMYQDGSNSVPKARHSLSIGVAGSTPWSSLGIKADGVTDNTAALNALPANTLIEADCKEGSFIRFDGIWNLKSNLNIKFQPGCRMVSYSVFLAGVPGNYLGWYAISQTDFSTPLTNVTLDGLTIQKDAGRSHNQERIMRVWINHFKLLNWNFSPEHDGAMFVRGSCQEIAYGQSWQTGTSGPGTPGIRHVGNMPKVSDCLQVADVWVHDNHIVSGDGPFQSCQPLTDTYWSNVSSDDILYEKNSGRGNVFALIGLDQNGAFNAFTCNNVVYRNNAGTGTTAGVLLASNGAPVTNVIVENQSFDMAAASTNNGSLWIRGDFDPAHPGSFANILFSNITVYNTGVHGMSVFMPTGGTLNGLTVRNSSFATPRIAHSNGTWQATVFIRGPANDVTLQGNVIYGAHAPGVSSVSVGFTDGVTNPGTVSRFRFLNNFIAQVPASNTALYMRNVATATISGNTIRRIPGAATTTGIRLWNADAVGPPVAPGSTDITLGNNTLNDLATPIVWTCNSGTTNLASYNIGDAGHTCP